MSPLPALPPRTPSGLLADEAPPAIYAQVSDFWTRNQATLPGVSSQSLFWDRDTAFKKLAAAAEQAKLYELGWDGYASPPPTDDSVARGKALLDRIWKTDLTPYSVLPSADGGIGISFRGKEGRRAVLEILNDGSGSFSIYGKGHPKSSGEFDVTSDDLTALFNLLSENL
jgi:hypothetical protein